MVRADHRDTDPAVVAQMEAVDKRACCGPRKDYTTVEEERRNARAAYRQAAVEQWYHERNAVQYLQRWWRRMAVNAAEATTVDGEQAI